MAKKANRPAIQRQALPTSDRLIVYGTVPLRLFLGATFVYAGLQKIADPGFLQPGASTYIGTQLLSYVPHSPIGFVLQWLALPIPQLAGLGVIVTELAVGALVLLGIGTRWAAAVGALLNFVLFLTASWTIQPYFLGSDSIYTVAWITLLLVGDQGVLSARPFFFARPAIAGGARPSAADPGRRRLLLQVGAAGVALVWVLALLPRTRGTIQASTQPPLTTTPDATPSAVASPTGTRIGAFSDLQSQGSLAFTDPATGDPAVAVALSGGSVVAFDAICTHAGCQVGYDPSQRLITCPCHGAAFDPARGAAVVAGPAPTPLASIKVVVGTDGGVYAG
jgi:thiosulfate dehydrogenase [quinone] large subunit